MGSTKLNMAQPNPWTDGLVFGYVADDRNLRLYKGEPTVNIFQQSRDIFAWTSTNGNACTLTRDLSTVSPIGGTPLKMVTSAADAYTDTYNHAGWNLYPTSLNEIWTVSVYVKADRQTRANIFLFETNNGTYSNVWANYIAIGTEWIRLTLTHSMDNASVTQIQVRLGGDSIADGATLWFDGLQIEKKMHATQFTPTSRLATASLYDLANPSTAIDLTNMSFDGTGHPYFGAGLNNYINKTALFDFSASDFTVEFWINMDASLKTTNTYHTILSLGIAFNMGLWRSGLYPGSIFSTYGGTNMFGTAADDSGYLGDYYDITGKYNHLVMNKNGTVSSFYLNGQLWATLTTPSIPSVSGPLIIGSIYEGEGSLSFLGKLPELRIYNRALSDNEVQQNFNTSAPLYGLIKTPTTVLDGLMFWVDAADAKSYPGTGIIWTDLSGKENHCTLVNGPTFSDGAIVFDGTDDYAYTASSDELNSTSLTIILWVDLSEKTGHVRLFSKNSVNGFLLNMYSNNLEVYMGNQYLSSERNITGKAFIAVTVGSGMLRFYINSVLTSQVAFTGTINGSTQPLVLGADYGGANGMIGNISVAQYYSRDLTQAEVTQNFNALRSRYGL